MQQDLQNLVDLCYKHNSVHKDFKGTSFQQSIRQNEIWKEMLKFARGAMALTLKVTNVEKVELHGGYYRISLQTGDQKSDSVITFICRVPLHLTSTEKISRINIGQEFTAKGVFEVKISDDTCYLFCIIVRLGNLDLNPAPPQSPSPPPPPALRPVEQEPMIPTGCIISAVIFLLFLFCVWAYNCS